MKINNKKEVNLSKYLFQLYFSVGQTFFSYCELLFIIQMSAGPYRIGSLSLFLGQTVKCGKTKKKTKHKLLLLYLFSLKNILFLERFGFQNKKKQIF